MMKILERYKSWFSVLVVCYVYFLASAASLNGFYEDWHFRDGVPRFGFNAMYEQTAAKPFVYRQLLPRTAEFIVNSTPEKLRNAIQQQLSHHSTVSSGETVFHMITGTADDPKYALAYIVTYYLCLLSLFIGMLSAQIVLKQFGFSRMAALIAPPLFILFFPVFETIGGYFYDCSEVMFLFGFAAAFQLRWGFLAAIPIALLATLNKESFPFYLIATAPLLLNNRFSIARVASLMLSFGLSVGMHILHTKQFSANPGGEVEFYLFDNLKFYINPLKMSYVGVVYRAVGPTGYNILVTMSVAFFALYGRKLYSTSMRWYFLVGGCVNLTLFILFAAPGELRNLSLLYPALLLFMAAAVQRLQLGAEGLTRLNCTAEWQLMTDWLSKHFPAPAAGWIAAFGRESPSGKIEVSR